MNNLSTIDSRTLTRDCPAVQIPSGDHGVLPQGTAVFITQSLGNSHTVRTDQGLFRISDADADALGLNPAPTPAPAPKPTMGSGGPTGSTADASGAEVSDGQVWDILRQCYDPEIPVNIVDLGLVYDMEMSKLPSGLARIDVKMTLTAPGCGMGPSIAGDAQQRLLMLDGVEEATVEIVWDPPWHQSMITAEGRRTLGLE
jgi:probable FeS assembly SUF system protein SufT